VLQRPPSQASPAAVQKAEPPVKQQRSPMPPQLKVLVLQEPAVQVVVVPQSKPSPRH
jgi:hypothetical protein